MIKLDGIYPPLPTSFDKSENLALHKMRDNIRQLSEYNLSGFLVLGSNGELVNLTEKEKLEVYEMARDAIPSNKLMIAGTGGQSTKETIKLTISAAKAGADTVLVLNPSYYKGLMTMPALASHYYAVAEASPVPVIIYNMPANSGLDMNADTIVEISSHPNIIGMKDSGGNIVKMGDVRFRVKPDFQILAGSAGFLLPALSVGAIGGILALANIAPKQCIEIYESFLAGDLDKARKIQLEMIPVNDAVTRKWGIPALKEAMDQIGLYGGPARRPVLPVTPDVKVQLINILDKNNIKPKLKISKDMKARKLLMIPGPIEFEPEVLQAMSVPTTSHIAPSFIECFGNTLDMMKEVWMCPSGQPFIIAGTGTLAMDIAGSNLIEPGDDALVISTGYFGERYAELLKRYGANVEILRAPLGDIVPIDQVEKELKKKKYKLLTFTHVDTSTAVLNDPKPFGELGKKYDVLTILDGVCSVAGEEIRQEEWGIDVVLTASQKAIGVPPGLALLMVSHKALVAWRNRKAPVGNYYADWDNWLPIMKAYADRKPSYFGTPAINLVLALEASLQIILKEGLGKRIERHRIIGKAFRSAMKALVLDVIPVNEIVAANTLSAPYYPAGVAGGELLSEISRVGIIVAGGLLPDLKTEYFRVGHMGSVNRGDVMATLGAIESGLKSCKYKFESGIGLKVAQDILNEV